MLLVLHFNNKNNIRRQQQLFYQITSPCTNRLIGLRILWFVISAIASAMARFCAPVGSEGKQLKELVAVINKRRQEGFLFLRYFNSRSPNCNVNSSSNTSLFGNLFRFHRIWK